MQPTTTIRRIAAATLAIGLGFLGVAALAGPASADHVDGVPYEGNPGCAAGEIEFKIDRLIDGPEDEGVYTASSSDVVVVLPDGATLPAGFQIEISDVVVGDGTITFTWEASATAGPVGVSTLLVKYGPGGLEFNYDPAVSTDTITVPDNEDASHLTFCGGLSVNPTDGGTDDGTTDDGTTDTGTTDTGTTDTGTTGAVAPTQVAGNVVQPQALPATGSNDRSLAIIGAALVLIGGGTLLYRRGLFQS